jgi:hypothetical protein
VISRRALSLAFAVAVLLALAGLAAHGRPLTGARGSGPSAAFFDYVFTSIVLVGIAIVVVAVIASLRVRPSPAQKPPRRWHLLSTILSLAAVMLLDWFLFHHHFPGRVRTFVHAVQPHAPPRGQPAVPSATHTRGAHLRWDEIAIVAALLAGAGVALLATRRTRPPRPWLRAHDEVTLALDESLDDLRSEPDLRRAIIAAYARMERAFAAAGRPRRPAEAPREFLARALGSLDTSAGAITRLTDLFEWAKFSQHHPEPAMRDEAIAALVAVRDELRAPNEAAA